MLMSVSTQLQTAHKFVLTSLAVMSAAVNLDTFSIQMVSTVALVKFVAIAVDHSRPGSAWIILLSSLQ